MPRAAYTTALGHRDAEWGVQVLASWLEPERDTAGVRSACGAERYAGQVFRLNHNIEPSASVQ